MSRLLSLYQQAERHLAATLKNPAACATARRKLNALMASRAADEQKIHDIYAQFLFRDLRGEALALAIQADQGDPDAQNDLALLYLTGDGVKKAPRQAMLWFRRAAEQGHADAQYNLGCCLEEGTAGAPPDPAAALKWYQKAAEQGLADAQFAVASCYDLGNGVPENPAEAVKWYELAAEQDHADAQYNLGCCYETGSGVPEDPAAAFQWFLRAARLEHPIAQDKLAWCYGEGYGTARDFAEAAKWLRCAAEQGVGNAMTHLGMCFEEGAGLPQDAAAALKWYRKAAALGEEGAAHRLEIMQPSGQPFHPTPDELAAYNHTFVEYQGRLALLEGTSPDGAQLRLWFVGDDAITVPAADCQLLHFTPDSEFHGSIYALFTTNDSGSGIVEHPKTYRGRALLYALQDLIGE